MEINNRTGQFVQFSRENGGCIARLEEKMTCLLLLAVMLLLARPPALRGFRAAAASGFSAAAPASRRGAVNPRRAAGLREPWPPTSRR
jgi:hypothetical protein